MNIGKTIENLEKRGFAVSHFGTREEAVAYLCAAIQDKVVGIGGSTTVQQIGLYEPLSRHNEVHWHLLDPSVENRNAATNAPVYITSANAVSEDGEIINIDGRGNRVAATLYNKDEVYIIIGTNKLAEDFDKALWRARNIAAPLNAKRLGTKTPCAAKGDRCYDCKSPGRICRGLVVLWGPMLDMQKIEVVIIDEELGF